MLLLLLLTTAAFAAASPIPISAVFVTASPLSLSYEVIDPAAGGLRIIVDGGPLGVQSYAVGGYLLLPMHPAIIGDTVAFGVTTQFGALLGFFLVHYNDGWACASALCELDPDHAMNVTHIRPGFLPDGMARSVIPCPTGT